MLMTSDAVVSGLFGNDAAIAWVLIVVGVIFVTVFVVTWIVLVRRGSNREWPIR
jgi:uncharacterized membrane protein